MIQIQIRPATIEDFDHLLVLLRQLWPTKPISPERLREVFRRAISTSGRHYFCAVHGASHVGFGSVSVKENLWQEGLIACVDELVVHEEHRAKGIGSQLLEHLSTFARENGCRRIELDSALHRTDAHRFYERHGFQKRAFWFSRVIDESSAID